MKLAVFQEKFYIVTVVHQTVVEDCYDIVLLLLVVLIGL